MGELIIYLVTIFKCLFLFSVLDFFFSLSFFQKLMFFLIIIFCSLVEEQQQQFSGDDYWFISQIFLQEKFSILINQSAHFASIHNNSESIDRPRGRSLNQSNRKE